MNLQQMKYVVCTAECGSISNAARKLFVTQPSLSNAIKELEQELNIQIFERRNSGVSLTKDGILFIEQIRSVLEQLQSIDSYYKKSKDSEHIFSIACQHSTFVPECTAQFIKDFGQEAYQIQVLEIKTREVLDFLQSGVCDIGILLKNRNNKVLEWEMEQKKLEFHHLASLQPHVFLHKSHPLAKKDIIYKEELKPYPYTKYYQGTDSMRFFSEELVENPVQEKVIIITDKHTDMNYAKYLHSYTLGSGLRPGMFASSETVAIPYASDEIIELGWVISKDKIQNSMMLHFIDIVHKMIDGDGIV